MLLQALLPFALSSLVLVRADVAFLSPVLVGAPIHQVYTSDSATYYDVAKNVSGSPLIVVHQTTFPPLAYNYSIGTPFDFVPVISPYAGYVQSSAVSYGHVALTTDTSLHLTVDIHSATTPLVPYLAPRITVDNDSQLTQLWSLDTSGILTFIGTVRPATSPAPAGYEPVPPTTSPEKVRVVPGGSTTGKFVMKGHAVNPCPPSPDPSSVIACPL